MSPAEYEQLERVLAADGFGPEVAFPLALLAEQLGAMREDRSRIDMGPAFLGQTVDRLLAAGGVDPASASVADVIDVRLGGRR